MYQDFLKKCLDQTILSFIFTNVCCTPTSNDFSQEEEKLSDKKLFCLKKYKSVKQQFSFWFFLIFSQAPFFRISNKVDSDSPGYLLSCHGCFFYRRNNFIKFHLILLVLLLLCLLLLYLLISIEAGHLLLLVECLTMA